VPRRWRHRTQQFSAAGSLNADDCNDTRTTCTPIIRTTRSPGNSTAIDNRCEGRLALAEVDADLDRGLPVQDTAPAADDFADTFTTPTDLGLAPCDPDARRPHPPDSRPGSHTDLRPRVARIWFVETAPLEAQGTDGRGDRCRPPVGDAPVGTTATTRRTGAATPGSRRPATSPTPSCARAFEGYVDTDGIPDPMVAPLPGYTTEAPVDVDEDGEVDACDPDGEGRWTSEEPQDLDLYEPDSGDSEVETGEEDPGCQCDSGRTPTLWFGGLGAAFVLRRRSRGPVDRGGR
jgi:hypothetical protein